MAGLSEMRTMTEQATADATAQVAKANVDAVNFLFGAQRLLLDELVFASNELVQRLRTEMHLFTELVSKMAGAHSVKGVREMAEECCQHQIDFIRRDSERVFNHGRRLIDTTSKLLGRELDS
jgi:hypothetical protein